MKLADTDMKKWRDTTTDIIKPTLFSEKRFGDNLQTSNNDN